MLIHQCMAFISHIMIIYILHIKTWYFVTFFMSFSSCFRYIHILQSIENVTFHYISLHFVTLRDLSYRFVICLRFLIYIYTSCVKSVIFRYMSWHFVTFSYYFVTALQFPILHKQDTELSVMYHMILHFVFHFSRKLSIRIF